MNHNDPNPVLVGSQILLLYTLFISISQGTTAQQDTRFSDKKKKLMKTMKFAEGLDQKVDIFHCII